MASRFEPNSNLRLRWPLASVAVAAAAPLLGCGPGDVELGFRVTNVAFDGQGTLTLTFSQPLANASAIDPNDFRLSVGRTYSFTYTDPESGQTETLAYTIYQDLGWVEYDYYRGPERFAFASAAAGSAADQLELEDAYGIVASACMFVTAYQMYYEQYQDPETSREVDMFLHYAASDIPLESEAGETLADIGREWVLMGGAVGLVRDGFGFTNLDPQLRIPCP